MVARLLLGVHIRRVWHSLKPAKAWVTCQPRPFAGHSSCFIAVPWSESSAAGVSP